MTAHGGGGARGDAAAEIRPVSADGVDVRSRDDVARRWGRGRAGCRPPLPRAHRSTPPDSPHPLLPVPRPSLAAAVAAEAALRRQPRRRSRGVSSTASVSGRSEGMWGGGAALAVAVGGRGCGCKQGPPRCGVGVRGGAERAAGGDAQAAAAMRGRSGSGGGGSRQCYGECGAPPPLGGGERVRRRAGCAPWPSTAARRRGQGTARAPRAHARPPSRPHGPPAPRTATPPPPTRVRRPSTRRVAGCAAGATAAEGAGPDSHPRGSARTRRAVMAISPPPQLQG